MKNKQGFVLTKVLPLLLLIGLLALTALLIGQKTGYFNRAGGLSIPITPPEISHLECLKSACVKLPGRGQNSCSSNFDCTTDKITIYNDTDSLLKYDNNWTRSKNKFSTQGTYTQSSVSNAQMKIESIPWYASIFVTTITGPNRGITKIQTLNNQIFTFDAYSPQIKYGVKFGPFKTEGYSPSYQNNIISFIVSGEKNPNSSGNYTIIDQIEIVKKVSKNNTLECDKIGIAPTFPTINPGERRRLEAFYSGGVSPILVSWEVKSPGHPGVLSKTTGSPIIWTAPSNPTVGQTWRIWATVTDSSGNVQTSENCTKVLSYRPFPTPTPTPIPTVIPVTYDNTSKLISYLGLWTTAKATNAFNGSYSYSPEKQASFSLPVENTRFATISTILGPNRGIADVLIDGVLQKSIDTYGKIAYGTDIGPFIIPAGSKTLTVINTGQKNSQSVGTMLVLDKIIVNK